jgi:hypothetical protein
MAQRLAAVAALIVFAICLLIGGFGAGNPFITAVERALVAMAATLGLGLIVGWMAQKMLEEGMTTAHENDQSPAAVSAGGPSATGPTTEAPDGPVPASAAPRARPDAEPVGKKKG